MTTALTGNLSGCTLRDALLLDFAVASVDLWKARHKQRIKDTPDHRDAVTAAGDRVDAVLDMYLDARDQVPLDER